MGILSWRSSWVIQDMTIRQLLSALFIVLILTVRADALDNTDYHRAQNLLQEFIQLQKDISDAERSAQPNASACFIELYTNLETVSWRLGFLSTLVKIASLMVDKSDEQTVLSELDDEASNFLNYLELSQKGINSIAGHCSGNNVAAEKVQEILSLYNKTSPLVRSFLSKPKRPR